MEANYNIFYKQKCELNEEKVKEYFESINPYIWAYANFNEIYNYDKLYGIEDNAGNIVALAQVNDHLWDWNIEPISEQLKEKITLKEGTMVRNIIYLCVNEKLLYKGLGKKLTEYIIKDTNIKNIVAYSDRIAFHFWRRMGLTPIFEGDKGDDNCWLRIIKDEL